MIFFPLGLLNAFGAVLFCTALFSGEDDTYRLGPRDRIQITVFRHADLNLESAVSSSGTITYPLIGTMLVEGLTALQLQENLKNALEKDYLQRADVSVQIIDYKSKVAVVLGKVNRTGEIPLTKPLNLIDVLSIAGGVSSNDVKKIMVIRPSEEPVAGAPPARRRDMLLIDYQKLFKEADLSLNIPIQNKDIVVVMDPSKGKFYITGEVRSSGAFDLSEGITVMKAITLAGGTTDFASTKSVYIKRIMNGKETKVPVNLNTPILEDDIIFVPESLF